MFRTHSYRCKFGPEWCRNFRDRQKTRLYPVDKDILVHLAADRIAENFRFH